MQPEERASLIEDFESAKALVAAILEQKLNFLKCLPWTLLGIAHWNATEARAAAKECMEMFDRT